MNLLFAIAALAAQAGADDAPKWRDPPACWDGAQSELNHCAWSEFRRADAEMNEQWARTSTLLKRVDKDHPPIAAIGQSSRSEALQKGQDAWLKYRDAYCLIFVTGGGTITSMLHGICMRDVTLARTQQLKSLMLIPGTDNPYYEDQ